MGIAWATHTCAPAAKKAAVDPAAPKAPKKTVAKKDKSKSATKSKTGDKKENNSSVDVISICWKLSLLFQGQSRTCAWGCRRVGQRLVPS